jgi:hypothetical protein
MPRWCALRSAGQEQHPCKYRRANGMFCEIVEGLRPHQCIVLQHKLQEATEEHGPPLDDNLTNYYANGANCDCGLLHTARQRHRVRRRRGVRSVDGRKQCGVPL